MGGLFVAVEWENCPLALLLIRIRERDDDARQARVTERGPGATARPPLGLFRVQFFIFCDGFLPYTAGAEPYIRVT